MPYLAPRYFTPRYFAPRYEGSTPIVKAVGDWDVLEAIRDALAATGEFDEVRMSDLPEERGSSSGDRNAAWVSPQTWEESTDFENAADTTLTRKVGWTLTIMVRRQDPEARDRELTRLLAVAQNAVDGRSVGGLTLPAWTRLKSGRYEKARPPERRLISQGTFAYQIPGFPNHPGD